MKREDQLDQFIEGHYYQGGWRLLSDDELADSLAAAERLARLQEIDIPADFARRLEVSIRARARSLPSQNGTTFSRVQRRSSPKNVRQAPMRRAWVAILGTAAILLAAFTGLLTASANSLPDGPLYGLKQAANQVRLIFASDPQTRASTQMEILQNALGDLSTEVNDRHDDAAIKLALQIVASRTHDSQEAVAALPAGSERATGQQSLASILADEEQTVRHLLTQVDWPLRVLFTKQLGVLGDQVPTVTSVLISVQSDGTFLVTLNGASFAPQAELIVDGQPKGAVTQRGSGQLVAILKSSELSLKTYLHTFGVLNPDGTAAQIILRADDDHDGQNQYKAPDGDGDADDRQDN